MNNDPHSEKSGTGVRTRRILLAVAALIVASAAVTLYAIRIHYWYLLSEPPRSRGFITLKGEDDIPVVASYSGIYGVYVDYAVWPDGRIIWKEKNLDQDEYHYRESYLTAAQMEKLHNELKKKVDYAYHNREFYPFQVIASVHCNDHFDIQFPDVDFTTGKYSSWLNSYIHYDVEWYWARLHACIKPFIPDDTQGEPVKVEFERHYRRSAE